MDQPHDCSRLPHELDGGLAARARIGLIVLATDQTIEHEWRLIFRGLDGVALHHSRIWNDARITPETLRAMEGKLADSAAVIMPGLPLASLAFGCTSATMVIGEEGVFARLREARPEARPTTPVTAAFAAFRAFGARRLAVLTPYRADVNRAVRRYLEGGGYEVPVLASFDEEDDHRAARISVASIRDAAVELGRDPRADTVFVACTSLRVVEVISEIEDAVGKPVTSSNHAMAWHALRLSDIAGPLSECGSLMRLQPQLLDSPGP